MRIRGFASFVVLLVVSNLPLAQSAAAQVDTLHAKEPVVRYDGVKVVRVEPRNATELQLARALSDDVWSEATALGMPVDLLVTAEQLEGLKRAGLRYTILIDDLQAVIDTESAQIQQAQLLPSSPATWFQSYHPYTEVLSFMKDQNVSYPSLVKYVGSIGKSVEQRDIAALRISDYKVNTTTKKQVIVLAGQHGREWISITTALFCIQELLTKFVGGDARVTSILGAYEFIFIPIVNPDGYDYTWTTDRYWRKNRGAKKNNVVYGVDLDRNWGNHFGGLGSSSNPSSETYRGTAAFSESETKAVSQYIYSLPDRLLFVDFQSYGQFILRPYGWTIFSPNEQPLQNEQALQTAGQQAVAAIRAVKGRVYISETIQQLFFSSGNAVDWVYDVPLVGWPMAFAVLLSPVVGNSGSGYGGYSPSAKRIIPVGRDAFAALLTLSEYALANPLY